MLLWKDFYENYVPGDSDFMGIPQLVFVCEDEKHMAEVFKTLYLNRISIKNIKFYYTTDLSQNDEELERSLYDFVEVDGKFRMRRVAAKILS